MNNATSEGLKEVGRWVVLLVISWVIAQTLGQVNAIPESLKVNIWVLNYSIPVRELFVFGLTFSGRFVDKWRFEKTKADPKTETKGILPF